MESRLRRPWRAAPSVLLSVVLLTAACVGGASPTGGPTSAETGGSAPASAPGVKTEGWESIGDVTLRVNAENASKDTLTELAGRWMERYPNITVQLDFKSFDDYMKTVLNVADSEDAPDILLGNQGYVTDGALVSGGLIVPLDKYFDAYGWTAWYGAATTDQFRFSDDGKTFGTGSIWGIAESADFVGIYYNVDKLAAIGVEPPASFADFETALEKAKSEGQLAIKLGNLEGWPATHDLGIAQGATWSAQEIRDWVFGKEGADYTAPGNLEAAKTFKDWVDKGYLSEDANGLKYDTAWAEFAQGDGVFLIAGSWLAAGLRDAMGEDAVGFIAPPPGDSGKVVAVAALSLPFHISARSKNQDLAAAFLDFVMAPDKGDVYFKHGRIAAAAGVTAKPDDKVTQQLLDAWTRIAQDDGLIYYQDWATDTMFDTITKSLQELIGGQKSPEEFVQTVQDDWAKFQDSR
jgi:raffinose/stachyose/melibiose transport system substrate-binding protein